MGGQIILILGIIRLERRTAAETAPTKKKFILAGTQLLLFLVFVVK